MKEAEVVSEKEKNKNSWVWGRDPEGSEVGAALSG